MTPLFVKLSRKKNTLTIIIISLVLYLLGFNLLAIASTIIIFVISIIIFSLGESLNATNNDYFIANHTPIGHRARFSTFISIIQGAGYACGPLLGGQLLELISFREVYHIVSALIIFCIFALIYVRHTYIRDGEQIVPQDISQS
ncbi:MAG: MFS transporter [Spirochaetia bacterium]|nr:MFS transporter [Spirochaetia bacterium]